LPLEGHRWEHQPWKALTCSKLRIAPFRAGSPSHVRQPFCSQLEERRGNGLGCCRRVDPHLKSRDVGAIVSDAHVIR